jgi:hypothetical protein
MIKAYIINTGQHIFSKDGSTWWSNYMGEDPFRGWVVLNKRQFEQEKKKGNIGYL